MRERDIEQYLVKRARESGGKAYKWVSPGNDGVPDRIVIFPGRVIFVELKAPGKKPTPLQLARHRELAGFGLQVLVIDSKEDVDRLILASGLGGGANEVHTS